MTNLATPPPKIEEAIRRAAGYQLLSRCFVYPDEGALDAMRDVAAAVGHLLAGGPLHGLLEELARADHEELEGAFINCYTLTTSPDCPTYETAYLCPDPVQQTARMADINGFYRAFGVDTVDTGFRPDDISVELEFMSFLCRKQAYAQEHLGAPRVAQVKRAQRMFLNEHLGRWAGPLGRQTVLRSTGSAFYRELGQALEDWVLADMELAGVKGIATVAGPALPFPEPGKEFGGAIGNAAGLIVPDEILDPR